MQSIRWQYVPLAFVVAGVALVWVCTFAASPALGMWQIGVVAGGLLALGAVFWLRRRSTAAELEIEAMKDALATERRELQTARAAAAEELDKKAQRIDHREQALAKRLIEYHEWMEFPQPIDLSQPHTADDDLGELAKKDRRMLRLLEAEARVVFEKIRRNDYAVDGKFQFTLARDDAYDLITRVAQVYQPDAENPLLETSMAQVLRGVSRACLHFLVVLDGLPLNVKEYNFNSMYRYVRQAVKAYGVYKRAQPYLPYVNTAYYIGRFAMGANPLTMGAWWLAGHFGQKGATALATRVVNRQALALMHDLVRVIGFEVAGVYGGDFRHRDANWIYAVELTELVSRFPLSRESLSHSLKEIGALQLRSEYDRVFLYRLLAAHKSADPQRFRAGEFLTADERAAVAARLEKFFASFIHGKSAKAVDRWHTEVEERLQIKFQTVLNVAPAPRAAQLDDAVCSLASFLLAVKQREVEELPELLAGCRLVRALDEQRRETQWQSLRDNPPFYFQHPDLDPSSDVVSDFLADLIDLATATSPHGPQDDEIIEDAAAYLRQDLAIVRGKLEKLHQARLAERFPPRTLPKKVPGRVARAVLGMLEDEPPRFLYHGVKIIKPAGNDAERYPRNSLWVVGLREHMVLLHDDDEPKLLWRGDRSVKATTSGRFVAKECRLEGGQWLEDEVAQPQGAELRVAAPTIGNVDSYFQPLLTFCDAETTGS